jgi:hypothetical protein
MSLRLGLRAGMGHDADAPSPSRGHWILASEWLPGPDSDQTVNSQEEHSSYVAVLPRLNRLRHSAHHSQQHCVAPAFRFTSTHLMAPEPASTVYTPQPRGEANIAKTTPTAAAIASTTTRARMERVTARAASRQPPRWPCPGGRGG